MYLVLQAMHPMRLEEVLGLRWEDVDIEKKLIHIQRAVTHPKRNQPYVKETKTATSVRTLAMTQLAAKTLIPGRKGDYILGGEKPLSYSQARKMCERIQRETGFPIAVTPIRFRTTVLTDLYDQTRDINLTQKAGGHARPSTTLDRYVKGRGVSNVCASAIDELYAGILPGNCHA